MIYCKEWNIVDEFRNEYTEEMVLLSDASSKLYQGGELQWMK